jgi:hypothetical protein
MILHDANDLRIQVERDLSDGRWQVKWAQCCPARGSYLGGKIR